MLTHPQTLVHLPPPTPTQLLIFHNQRELSKCGFTRTFPSFPGRERRPPPDHSRRNWEPTCLPLGWGHRRLQFSLPENCQGCRCPLSCRPACLDSSLFSPHALFWLGLPSFWGQWRCCSSVGHFPFLRVTYLNSHKELLLKQNGLAVTEKREPSSWCLQPLPT